MSKNKEMKIKEHGNLAALFMLVVFFWPVSIWYYFSREWKGGLNEIR